jgi:hypothetical protein
MKRLLRWTINGAVIVSATLCLAIIMLCLRSYRFHDAIRWQQKQVTEGGGESWWRSWGYELNFARGRATLVWFVDS